MSHGVVHFEIAADDPEKLSKFYGDLFGWKIQKMPMDGMDYWTVETVATDDKGQRDRARWGDQRWHHSEDVARPASDELRERRVRFGLRREGEGARREGPHGQDPDS